MVPVDDIYVTIGILAAPYIVAFITLVTALIVKDIVMSISKGLSFRFSPNFSEGDNVLLDGEPAIIVKIGLTTSVFGVMKDNKNYCWRYVPNQRISYIKLEKIIMRKDRIDELLDHEKDNT